MRWLAPLALAGCSATGPIGDNDANDGCQVVLHTAPDSPVAGDHVRVTATVLNSPGVLGYAWLVDGAPNSDYEAADHSAIGFDAPDPVPHTVRVDVTPASGSCAQGTSTINIGNPSGHLATYRLRVVPDAAVAPPQEVVVQIHGGQALDRPVLLDPGERVQGAINNGATLVPGYLRFVPLVGPSFDAVTGTGSYDVHLTLQAHTVIVVPANNALAPKLVAHVPGSNMNTFQVDAGTAWSGTVVDRTGAPLANASVQLTSGGLPSTLATTNGSGAFTVRHTFAIGAQINVVVTPPPGSGLARLDATAAFDQSQTLAISYVGSPATCDIAGAAVKRSGANQGGAKVTIVGTLTGTPGTVTTGAVTQPAAGTVHVAATASGAGTLPSTIVPRAPLSAVAAISLADLAVAAIDTSVSCGGITIDAPAMIVATGTTRTAQAAINGVSVSALPVGALAMANLIPVDKTSDATGHFSLSLAAGGHYKVSFTDPGGRGAPLVFDDLLAPGVPSQADLPNALALTGDVAIASNPNPIESASVQVLCTSCTGIEAQQAIAQTVTDIASHFRVAVPDPGM